MTDPIYRVTPIALEHAWDYNVPDPIVIKGSATCVVVRASDRGPNAGSFVLISFGTVFAYYHCHLSEEDAGQRNFFGTSGCAVELVDSWLKALEDSRALPWERPQREWVAPSGKPISHFALLFFDDTIEVLSDGISTELFRGSRDAAIAYVLSKTEAATVTWLVPPPAKQPPLDNKWARTIG